MTAFMLSLVEPGTGPSQIIYTAIGSLAGGGLVFLAIRERLRDTFPTKDDLNAVQAKLHTDITRTERSAEQMSHRVNKNEERVSRLEEKMVAGERRMDDVLVLMRDLQAATNQLSERMASIEASNRAIAQSLDLLREELRQGR